MDSTEFLALEIINSQVRFTFNLGDNLPTTTIKTFLFPPFLAEFQNSISIFFKFPLWSLLDEEQQ
jgi:hypothetical protein